MAALIDAIYVQERTDDTDKQCEDAKNAWDALTDEQKEYLATNKGKKIYILGGPKAVSEDVEDELGELDSKFESISDAIKREQFEDKDEIAIDNVNKDLETAESIWIEMNIRNVKYTYKLKVV